MSAHLSLKNIAACYGAKTIVKGISFDLEEGEIGCLLGPSGCGKTTLLRTIAGFEQPTQGSIVLRNNEVASNTYSVPPEKRRVGMVFQDYALFPHLSIEQNIAFGLSHQNKLEQKTRVDELLELIGLTDTGKRYPHQLSGGQQQRIALARALAPKPDILLLDEPFSNLDVELREQLAHDIRHQIKAEQVTAILVTHDQQEAFATADKIALLNNGALVQWGSASELYNTPNSVFTAEFIGQGSIVAGRINKSATGLSIIHTEFGDVPLPQGFSAPEAKLLIRPDQLHLSGNGPEVLVTMKHKSFRGGHFLCTLETSNQQQVIAYLPPHDAPSINEQFSIFAQLEETIPIAVTAS